MAKKLTAKKAQIKKTPVLGYSIRQERSQLTYDALIATGFKLLETQSFESITVDHLARKAGYSVGAFYSRFRSKDEYFNYMLQHHIAVRLEVNKQILSNSPPETVVEELFSNMVTYFVEHANFWRALIIRNASDPEFWQPLRQLGEQNARDFLDYLREVCGRRLTATEKTNVLFAFQAVRSIINNTIINNPGPLNLAHKDFVANLTRAFCLIADYHNLIKSG